MDLGSFKVELVQHYVSMACLSVDWKRQAWHSVNDLAQRFPSEFGELPALLTKEMKERANAD